MSHDFGLRKIVAARTGLCQIDGEKGALSYRGIPIEELAENSPYEEVIHLLWYGTLPRREELEALRRRLAAVRALPPDVADLVRSAARRGTPMDALRTVVSALAHDDPDVADRSREANFRKAERILSAMGTALALFDRMRRGEAPVDPDPNLGYAANFLYALHGRAPDRLAERALDACLVLHAEHGLNASTFAARVTASTLSDLHSAIVSAIGTLKGPLHGGANQWVMRMLEEIGEVSRVERFVGEQIEAGKKFPGFGHAVYRADDPRAGVLRRLSGELAAARRDGRWHDLSIAVEAAVKSRKTLPVNVDFFSAAVYRYLGVPDDLFPAMFACSRVAGWAAHVFEQYADNRLIRPDAEYTGPASQRFVPIERREA